jgi:hypothetical protein
MPRFVTWDMSFEPEGFQQTQRRFAGVEINPDVWEDPGFADVLLRLGHSSARHSFYYAILAESFRPADERRIDTRAYPIEHWLSLESRRTAQRGG